MLNMPLDSCVLGDAGLLASMLVDSKKITPVYELGIVPHYGDKSSPVFQKILKEVPRSVLLDPTVSPIEFLKNLCQCRTVISTAMHPIIACDALRIPNLWIRLHNSAATEYKFYDYYSVFGLKPEPFYAESEIPSPEYVAGQYKITDGQVYGVQQNLLNALHRLSADIKSASNKIFCYAALNKLISAAVPGKDRRKRLKRKLYLG